MAAVSYVFTISRVAEMLGEDEDWLHELSIGMAPEDGHLFISDAVTRPPPPSPAMASRTSASSSSTAGARPLPLQKHHHRGPHRMLTEDNRFTLMERLKREGYLNIACASNGREAIELLAERRFDLMLLDITMPEMDGYEVLENLKADTMLRSIPVVMISAVDEIDSVARCIGLGAEDYLTKPFNAVLLRARIAACLEKKRLRDQETLYTEQIENEKRRANELLYAMLPSRAVGELKATNEVRPRRYNEVAVLFCDIVGFTPYCDQNPPEKTVAELQALVGEYERIVCQHGMEKIKTIGDAFLATAGLLNHVPDPILASLRTRHGGGVAPHRARMGSPGRRPVRTGRGGNHRAAAIRVRPVGRHREHGGADLQPGQAGSCRDQRCHVASHSRPGPRAVAGICRCQGQGTGRADRVSRPPLNPQ